MLCLGIYGLIKADRNHKEGVIDDLSNHHPNTTQMQSLKELSDAEKNEMVECMVVGGEPIDIHGSLVRKMEGVLRMDDISERSGRSTNNNYLFAIIHLCNNIITYLKDVFYIRLLILRLQKYQNILAIKFSILKQTRFELLPLCFSRSRAPETYLY